jgi:ABC-type uncharacterized transport system permease subunit
VAELLFWPALLAYGEAAVAYFGETRNPGRSGRLATWGVRIGWLVQTALLVLQAARDEGFPWASWAGSLNLFVWLVVGVYLIWGCRPRFRMLGLAVMPLAVLLFALARVGGGTGLSARSDYSNLFLVLHVGLVLVAFAGFTLAACLSSLYLWQERRLKRRERSILRMQLPPLETLDRFAARTIAVALPALTLGLAVGIARLARDNRGFDPLIVATLLTWAVYGAYFVLRLLGWHGRRTAYLAVAGLVLVFVVRLALPATHFA